MPLHYYTDRAGLIETNNYVVQRFSKDRVVRGKRQWRVKFRGFCEAQWHYAGYFMHNINDTWARYNCRKAIDVSLSDLRCIIVDFLFFYQLMEGWPSSKFFHQTFPVGVECHLFTL